MEKKILVFAEQDCEPAEVAIPVDLLRRVGMSVSLVSSAPSISPKKLSLSIKPNSIIGQTDFGSIDVLILIKKESSEFSTQLNCDIIKELLEKNKIVLIHSSKEIFDKITVDLGKFYNSPNLLISQNISALFFSTLKLIKKLLGEDTVQSFCKNFNEITL